VLHPEEPVSETGNNVLKNYQSNRVDWITKLFFPEGFSFIPIENLTLYRIAELFAFWSEIASIPFRGDLGDLRSKTSGRINTFHSGESQFESPESFLAVSKSNAAESQMNSENHGSTGSGRTSTDYSHLRRLSEYSSDQPDHWATYFEKKVDRFIWGTIYGVDIKEKISISNRDSELNVIELYPPVDVQSPDLKIS